MADKPNQITYGNDIWHRSSGQQPYDYALRWAWLRMIEELFGADGDFQSFFEQVPDGMFVDNEHSKPFTASVLASGHLDHAQCLFFSASQNIQYIENGIAGRSHFPTQTVITLTMDPYPNHVMNCFSTVVFNSTCTFDEGMQAANSYGATALAQSGFELSNFAAEHYFRDAVLPLKLSDHPLLKHYKF